MFFMGVMSSGNQFPDPSSSDYREMRQRFIKTVASTLAVSGSAGKLYRREHYLLRTITSILDLKQMH